MSGNPTDGQKAAPEKDLGVVLIEEARSLSDGSQTPSYGGDRELPPPPPLSTEEQRRLWRKIDWHIMPIITIMYLCSFVDRSNIGNAKLQGLVTQLDLTGNRYNIALTMYFISYDVCAIPASIVLKKFRPSRWLPGITVLWGITTSLMGIVKNYPQLVAVRLCLGVAEAGFAPGVFIYLSMWYPRHMLQTRLGLFWGGATLAGAFSGLFAFVISFMSGTAGLLGWSWIFIIEGIITVVVGVIAFFVLVDFPNTARFLTPEERTYVIHRKKVDNSSVGEDEHFALRHVWEAFTDWQVWLISLVNMTVLTAVYGISLFLPSTINGFGFNATISQLMTVPPYVVATATVIIWSIWSDRIKKRSPFVLCGLLLCLTGFAINISNASIGVKYFATFLVATGAYGAYPADTCWLTNNLAGHYKRAVGIAIQVIFGTSGGAIASNIFRSQDAPRYILGNGLEMMFVSIGLILTPIILFVYTRENARKGARVRDMEERGEKYAPEELRKMGDRAPEFKYTL
ncbi:MFS general substrate transporter [Dichomitus squalens]|uniref:MFS general substrate transporter n=2 Tax=Dichomitus squalens TaxID=114155 RepID=A0A4Q9PNQ9_9APHY|nr:MFS general substrate transporter [Dichomitus squalens]TBU55923.1 MFS general substrate transporter [Dichomitus squalens]